MKRDFTLEDVSNLINTSNKVTLKKVGKLIKDSERSLETKFTKKMDEKFQEAKDFAEDRFNWLAKKTSDEFVKLENKVDDLGTDLRREMRNGFEKSNKRLDFIEKNHGTRLEVLEEKIVH